MNLFLFFFLNLGAIVRAFSLQLIYFNDLFIFIFFIWMFCFYVYKWIAHVHCDCEGQKRVPDPLQTELWGIVSHHVGAETWTLVPWQKANALIHWAISTVHPFIYIANFKFSLYFMILCKVLNFYIVKNWWYCHGSAL